jgi:Zn-dependent protease with chaperone function
MFPDADLDEFLPAWALWGQLVMVPVLVFIVSYLGFFTAAAIAAGPRPLPEIAAWQERARHGHQVRLALGWMFLVLLFVLSIGLVALDNPITSVSSAGRAAVGLPFLLGSNGIVQAWRRRHIGPRQVRLLSVYWDYVATWTVLGWPWFILAIVAGLCMPRSYNTVTWFLIGAVLAAAVATRYCGHIWLLRCLGGLRPASPRLLAAVARAAGGRRLSAVYELRVSYGNAFALVGCDSLIFTTRLLEISDDDELATVAAHELAHLDDPGMQRLLVVSWLIVAAALALVQIRPARATWGDWSVIAILWVAAALVLLSGVFTRRILSAGEEHADRTAMEDQDATIYAGVLETIYRDSLVPVAKKSRLGHPALYDRMLASGVQPTYPRPRNPSLLRVAAGVVVSSTVSICLIVGFLTAGRVVGALSSATRPETALINMALMGGSTRDLARIARELARQGEEDFALAVAKRMVEHSPDSPRVWRDAATVLTMTGRHEAARAARAKALELGRTRPGENEMPP